MTTTSTSCLSSEELLEIFSLSENAIAIYTSGDLVIEAASDAMISFWGRDRSVIGKTLEDAVPELKEQPFPGLLKTVWSTGVSYEAKDTPAILRVNGRLQKFYFDFKYKAVKNEAGEVYCILHTAADVTERVLGDHREQGLIRRLGAGEKKLKTILTSLPVPLCILKGPEFIVELANEAILTLMHRRAEDVVGMPVLEILPELADQQLHHDWLEVLSTGKHLSGEEDEVFIYLPNGRKVTLNLTYHYQPLLSADGLVEAVIATVMDVTEHVRSRKKIERAEEMLRQAVSTVELGTCYIDASTRGFLPSDRLKEIFGFQPWELMGYDDVIAQITDEYRQKVKDALEAAITQGKHLDMEYPIIERHDQKLCWVRMAGKLYPATEGTPAHFSATILDITERKLDELRKNAFIGMVSHELKTPLTSLKAYAQMLIMRATNQQDEFTISALSKVDRQVNKMSSMINGFLNVSRLESGKIFLEKENFSVNDLIKEIIDEVIPYTSTHDITFIPCDALSTVNADREKIGHVISNLLSNAIKYSPKRRDIEVKCELINDMVQISVKDEGMGIKPLHLEKLFEPYYRVETHHTQHISGFGIGLYISAEIVKRHGGKIWVTSISGTGSTFFFTLPTL